MKSNIDKMMEYAATVPELGHGGQSIKDYLVKYASQVSPRYDIVDIAPWFGATTVYMAIGLISNGNHGTKINSYDLWKMDKTYIGKMKSRHGINYPEGDAHEYFFDSVEPFRGYINSFKQDITKPIEYTGKPIGLFCDDICSRKSDIDGALKNFSSYFVKGMTILIMMDYYYFKLNDPAYRESRFSYADRFFKINKTVFHSMESTHNENLTSGIAHIFRYMGGEINYGVDE